jgi:hypothetical protein
METIPKTTLFRFVALRKAEQIEESKIQSFFIKHPNPESSTLHALDKEIFQSNVTTFVSSSKDELRNLNAQLHDFGKWIFQNRDALTVANYQEKFQQYSPIELSGNDLLNVWDKLSIPNHYK